MRRGARADQDHHPQSLAAARTAQPNSDSPTVTRPDGVADRAITQLTRPQWTAYGRLVPPDLPETTYAVLGLLDMKPASGYDLAAFAERTLGSFWPISRTLVYRELGRLESLGWVESEPVPQDRLPDKRVWSSTEGGRVALTGWLAQPAVPGGADRNGFLVKFFFGDRMSPESMRRLLDDYREILEATRADLTALIEHLAGVPDGRQGRRSARHGLRTAQARLEWIDEVEADMAETSQLPPAEETDLHNSAHHHGARGAPEARETA